MTHVECTPLPRPNSLLLFSLIDTRHLKLTFLDPHQSLVKDLPGGGNNNMATYIYKVLMGKTFNIYYQPKNKKKNGKKVDIITSLSSSVNFQGSPSVRDKAHPM